MRFMAYCPKCGKKLKDSAKFCGKCVAKRTSHTPVTKEVQKPKSHLGTFVFIIILILLAYLALDYWAIKQIEIDTSASSILNSIGSSDIQFDLLRTELETELRLHNPTFIPILANRVSYDLSYGDTVIGEGETDVIFIMPYDSTDLPLNFEVSHISAARAMIEGFLNKIKNEKKSLILKFYAKLGPIKIPIGGLQ